MYLSRINPSEVWKVVLILWVKLCVRRKAVSFIIADKEGADREGSPREATYDRVRVVLRVEAGSWRIISASMEELSSALRIDETYSVELI